MDKKKFQESMEKLWAVTKKDFHKISKETNVLFKKGEVVVKDISSKGKKNLEVVNLKIEKEKLYYELGKNVAKDKKVELTCPEQKNYVARILDIDKEIKKINKDLGKKKKISSKSSLTIKKK